MLTLKTAHLKAALTHAAVGDIRYYLNGVLIERTACGDVHIVGTDGHRMFCGLIAGPNVDCDQVGPWKMIVPGEAIKRAIALKSDMLYLNATPDGRYTLGTLSGSSVGFVPIDGNFPDWRRVKPATEGREVASDVQYNWDYVADAQKALRLWYGTKTAYYWLKSYTNAVSGHSETGLMLGSDCTACVVVMPVRTDKVVCASPFTPAPYEASKATA